ncbi:MAG: bifunctional methylenetetrahydrofolate dehydrogenase/methenyltetrahydrofolate cyclohydrolase FolD [Legionellales bacterium]|nr:bifunctional methylenetetrahydrofolate dehydrogenase/methenyltetrahydrofolate cyclohydrolase FolD [Legionellales bacterium]
MKAQILDGKLLAQQLRNRLSEKIAQYTQYSGRKPGLGVILVGNDPASEIYVRNKKIACLEVGIEPTLQRLPTTISQHDLMQEIHIMNQNPAIDGFIVQTPLPRHLNEKIIFERIAAHKDIDGFHPYNIGRLALRVPLLRPCTPFGIMRLLDHYQLPVKGQHTVIVGASNVVGRPMALEILLVGGTVTVTHRFTEQLATHVAMADILIVAIGKRGVIQSDWIKPGAVVIDVGMNRDEAGKLCGDVEFATAANRASWITPVPGGVGPMTVYSLLENTYLSASELHTP